MKSAEELANEESSEEVLSEVDKLKEELKVRRCKIEGIS